MNFKRGSWYRVQTLGIISVNNKDGALGGHWRFFAGCREAGVCLRNVMVAEYGIKDIQGNEGTKRDTFC